MEITLAKNIRELRLRKGLTQERLASYLGVSFQAISKWEHGETYPDICMLPAIASFFNVTIDYLLCIDKAKKDQAVSAYINEYEKLWSEGRYDEVKAVMKTATQEFPGEFTLLVRYLNVLIWGSTSDDSSAVAARNEIEEIYTMIQSNCTVDSIRIWAKKLVCKYYFRLSEVKNSGIGYTDVKNILSEMPLMQNSRDYLSCIYNSSPQEKEEAVKNLVNEAVYLLCRAVDDLYSQSNDWNDAAAYKCLADILDAVYPEKDFGKNYINAAIIYAKLADYLSDIDTSEADRYMKLSLDAAERFDSSDSTLFYTSPLVKGGKIQKKKVPMAQGDPLRTRISKIKTER